MKMTELEKKMFDVVAWGCYRDCGLTVEELAEECDLKIHGASGVLGSLVKKDLVTIEILEVNYETFRVAMPVLKDKDALGKAYACDDFSRDEWSKIVSEALEDFQD